MVIQEECHSPGHRENCNVWKFTWLKMKALNLYTLGQKYPIKSKNPKQALEVTLFKKKLLISS